MPVHRRNIIYSQVRPVGCRSTNPERTGAITLPSESSNIDAFLAGVERKAYRMTLYETQNSEDALDIVQDTMCRLVSRYSTRDADEWAPLFYRILQNRIRDWRRREWVRNRWRILTGHQDDGMDFVESAPDPRSGDIPDRKAQALGTIEALERGLDALPMRQRQAVMLRLWEGLDVAETAAAMGCSQGSVKTHYFRGINSLRTRLGAHWP